MAVVGAGICLLVGAWGCSRAAANPPLPTPVPARQLIPPGTGLFGSHEFRSTLRALPGWERVMAAARPQLAAMEGCDPGVDTCSAAALSWQKILARARDLPLREQLAEVNRFFNRWPYRLDIDVYGTADYWATPGEFLRLSGDCEDYCITKYYALRSLGVAPKRMRIVVVLDKIRNITHAVLAVATEGDNLILDNLSDLLLPDRRYQHYVPQYSVNEHYRWAHVSPTLVRQVLPPRP